MSLCRARAPQRGKAMAVSAELTLLT